MTSTSSSILCHGVNFDLYFWTFLFFFWTSGVDLTFICLTILQFVNLVSWHIWYICEFYGSLENYKIKVAFSPIHKFFFLHLKSYNSDLENWHNSPATLYRFKRWTCPKSVNDHTELKRPSKSRNASNNQCAEFSSIQYQSNLRLIYTIL